jgi:hypothetical protein
MIVTELNNIINTMLTNDIKEVNILSVFEKLSEFFFITHKNKKLKIISNKLRTDKKENTIIRKVFFSYLSTLLNIL